MNNINIFKSAQEAAQNFAEHFIKQARQSTKFSVALSGGSTPKLLFDWLAENYSDPALWQNIHLYWGDERCVSPDDDESNFKMAKKHLLDKIDIPVQNIHRILGENNPVDEVKRYAGELLENLPVKSELPVFDLIILGLGDDGHTASIFPNQMELLTSDNICEMAEHPISGQKRITLTGKVINNAREIAFLVTGENKKQKIFEIINKTGNWKNYPASHINSANGNLSWFVDKAAAGLIS